MEIFKYCKQYDVEVSTEGRIRQGGCIRKNECHRGYWYNKTKYGTAVSVARAMALTFLPNPYKLPKVGYLDGNEKNINLGNLYWRSLKRTDEWKIAHSLELKAEALRELGV